jgi:hypothetical protein
MNNWNKFTYWWQFTGKRYLARTIIVLLILALTVIITYPNPFSWGVLLSRLGMIFAGIIVIALFIWAWDNME